MNPELKDMFFALGLIESFDSGVRRAKHTMRDNGSPALVYEPTNDADDYTMVTSRQSSRSSWRTAVSRCRATSARRLGTAAEWGQAQLRSRRPRGGGPRLSSHDHLCVGLE